MENLNWVKEFNKLFATLNSTETYFKGSDFINVIKEFDPYHADYNQYIEYRRNKELSTSRKNFFYDILMSYKEELRIDIVKRLYALAAEMKNKATSSEPITETDDLSDLLPSEENVVPELILAEELIEEEAVKIEEDAENEASNTETIDNPVVFISYSWDDDEHSNWILNLAKRLFENGVQVILDRYELRPGANMMHFMESAIRDADKVLIVFTPNYRLKAEKRQGGVGYEYSILNVAMYHKITENTKFIPILKAGSFEESIPEFMQQFIAVNMTDPTNFEEMLNSLLLSIYNKPQLEKPQLGKSPF